MALKTYIVYILDCVDGSYYTGLTNNLERRLAEHQSGEDSQSYTYGKRPVNLVYHESFGEPNTAIQWEKQIKGWSHAKKEALIQGDWDRLKELSNQ